MRRQIAAVTLFLLAATTPSFAEELRGSWAAKLQKDPSKVHVQLHYERSNHGNTMPLASFTGLTSAQMNAATSTPVQFGLKREAGSVAFDGAFKNGHGGGEFVFTPNEAYYQTIQNLGVPLGKFERKRERVETLFSLALLDVSTAFIRSMIAEGYRVDLDDYMSMRIFDVTPELIREMRALGYNLSAEKLVETQVHKVTPEYIRAMRASGWGDLPLDDLVSSRIHKVTPEFSAEMKAAGYRLDFDDLTAFRIHGVTTEFIRELRALGYTKVDADDLVAMRIHRVTPQFIRELREAGYEGVPVDKLVSMRIHGVDAAMVKKMNKK
ncbi:MAG TPA: hypothetical protein VF618_28550 [Thermoanaerobaculia bacterium]